MKLLKLFAALGLLMTGASQAATITVSAGLANQGFTPTINGTAVANFTWSVGTWNTATQTFTAFGSVADTGEVNGSVTATGPTSFNSQVIALFIGTGSTIAESGQNWVVLTHNSGTTFPSDVTQATGVTFAATTPGVVTIVGTGNENHSFGAQTATGYALNFVPEPSAALLGLLGVAGLLRRRR
jgi:hypothetical protein